MINFTLHPEIQLSADEIAEGVSRSDINEIVGLIEAIDNYVQDWDFPVALLNLVADMLDSEDFIRDMEFLKDKGETEVERAVKRLQEATAKIRRQGDGRPSNRTVVVCIIGESGAGKTMAANYIQKKYGWKPIASRTTRKPRYEGEKGHTYITKEEYNSYFENGANILAYTSWEQEDGSMAYYCCLEEDLKEKNLYVIDEFGYKALLQNWGHELDIISIRIKRNYFKRRRDVGEERIKRDIGKFKLPMSSFTHVVTNDGTEKEFYEKLDNIFINL